MEVSVVFLKFAVTGKNIPRKKLIYMFLIITNAFDRNYY